MTTKTVKQRIDTRRNGHQRDRSLTDRGCRHLGMRAVTPEEVPNLEDRKLKPFICEDCTSEAVGQQRFTHAQVINILLNERRQQEVSA